MMICSYSLHTSKYDYDFCFILEASLSLYTFFVFFSYPFFIAFSTYKLNTNNSYNTTQLNIYEFLYFYTSFFTDLSIS